MSLTERIPAERIAVEAREIRPGRTVATVGVGVFYAVGWLAAKAWGAVAFAAAAVKVGWKEGRSA